MSFTIYSNEFFDPSTCYEDKSNWMGKISTEGFSIYSYLLMKQGVDNYVEVSLKMIQTFFKRESDDKCKLIYSQNKIKNVSRIKDKRTLIKYLDYLNNNIKLIEYDGIVSSRDVRINDIIYIKVHKFDTSDGKFEMINNDIFSDYIHKIGHIGWGLYCVLSRLHNYNFGSETSIGFACPTQEYLSSVLHIRPNTLSAYSKLLERCKLIDIEVSKPKFSHYDVNGNEIFEYTPNSYIVKAKDPDNKYYINKAS